MFILSTFWQVCVYCGCSKNKGTRIRSARARQGCADKLLRRERHVELAWLASATFRTSFETTAGSAGEDAFFVGERRRDGGLVCGVADGVAAWEQKVRPEDSSIILTRSPPSCARNLSRQRIHSTLMTVPSRAGDLSVNKFTQPLASGLAFAGHRSLGVLPRVDGRSGTGGRGWWVGV